jgi:hypothetical protein
MHVPRRPSFDRQFIALRVLRRGEQSQTLLIIITYVWHELIVRRLDVEYHNLLLLVAAIGKALVSAR